MINVDPLFYGSLFNTPKIGLQVSGKNFIRNGKVFSGIGINHYSLALNQMVDMGVGGIANSANDIKDIKAYGLPFIRCAFGWYDGNSWYNNYYLNKSSYFAALDNVVANCENNNIGLIPTLLWSVIKLCDSTFNIYGTYSPPSALSDKKSKAWLLASTYITEVVTRYKDSPAIWAWGLGNEICNSAGAEYHSSWIPDGSSAAWLNWGTRPTGGNYLASDKMTMNDWRIFSKNCIDLIHSIDTSGRFISSGSPIGNSFAVTAQTTNSFASDTLAQWNSAANGLSWVVYRDQCFDTVCNHIYPKSLSNSLFFNGAEKTQAELIALTKGWADAANKPFFLEEWGATYHGDPVDETSTDITTETANFNSALQAIITNNIQLSSAWNYGGNFSGSSAWMKWKMSDPAKAYQLIAIANANANMNN